MQAQKKDVSPDPGADLKKMFIDMTMGPRINAGQCPVRRAVFLKPHGVVKADFIILPGLDKKYKAGIFAMERFEAWIRFSSDTVPGSPDFKATAGVAIKLFGVPGKKLLEPDEQTLTADFLLQNMDIFFVDTAKDMAEFTKAGVVDHDYGPYLKDHPETARILDEMEKKFDSCLDIPYWSGLPYALGNEFVKYKLEPIAASYVTPTFIKTKDYLAAELAARLNLAESQFKFMAQLRTDPDKMPLDKATVRWDEKLSPYVQVATVVLHQQDITLQGQAAYGENLSFNPWRTLKEHEPQGSISEVRKIVYRAGAELRHFENGIADSEPIVPRPLNHKI